MLLAACTATPLRAPTPVEVPAAWRAPLPHEGSTSALAGWWKAFPDQTLARLIERAEAANATLQVAAARHRQSQAMVTQARAGLWPQVGLNAASTRGKNLNNVSGVSIQSDAEFNASWEIDLFGAKRAESDEKVAQATAAQQDWHAARVTLAADVATAYVTLRLAQAREEAIRLDAMLAAQLVAWGRRQHASGLLNATELALLQTDASLATARCGDERAEAQVALQRLALLLGEQAGPLASELQPPALPLGWTTPLRQVPSVPAFAVGVLPAQLLAQRPDVAAAHQRWLAAIAHQRSVDARRYPQLSLGALAGEARLSAGGLGSSSSLWSIGPTLTLPLFDGGQRRAQGEAALAATDETAAALRSQWQTAVVEVEESLERVNAARAHQGEAEAVAREWQGIAERAALQLKAGLSSGPERVAAQRNALTARNDLLTARADQAQAWFRLYRSLGGGWNSDPGSGEQLASHP